MHSSRMLDCYNKKIQSLRVQYFVYKIFAFVYCLADFYSTADTKLLKGWIWDEIPIFVRTIHYGVHCTCSTLEINTEPCEK